MLEIMYYPIQIIMIQIKCIYQNFDSDQVREITQIEMDISTNMQFYEVANDYKVFVSYSQDNGSSVTLTIKEYNEDLTLTTTHTKTLNCSSTCYFNKNMIMYDGSDAYVAAYTDIGYFYFELNGNDTQNELDLSSTCAGSQSGNSPYINEFDYSLYFKDQDRNILCVINLKDSTEVYSAELYPVNMYDSSNSDFFDNIEFVLVGVNKYAMYNKDIQTIFYFDISQNTQQLYKTIELYKYQTISSDLEFRIIENYVLLLDASQPQLNLEIQSVNQCTFYNANFAEFKRISYFSNDIFIFQDENDGIYVLGQNELAAIQQVSCCDGDKIYYGKTDNCPNQKEEETTTTDNSSVILNVALIFIIFTLIL